MPLQTLKAFSSADNVLALQVALQVNNIVEGG